MSAASSKLLRLVRMCWREWTELLTFPKAHPSTANPGGRVSSLTATQDGVKEAHALLKFHQAPHLRESLWKEVYPSSAGRGDIKGDTGSITALPGHGREQD